MVRFDQPCYAIKGAVEYFRQHMAVGEYLTEHGHAEMTWFGRGAARLGLSGHCALADFISLCRGRDPRTGAKLLLRDKGSSRRVCYFGQISPPKDVSILHLVAGDDRIAAWWREAVEETLHEMELTAATRVRRGGRNADRTTGNVVCAIVTHDSNRALDPQLHTHVCFMNLTWDATEERWKSLQASGLFRHQAFFREVCYNRLAARLLAAGYELEPARQIGFTIKGLPPELRERFSKRRRTILAEAAATGQSTQDELQQLALETRARKSDATASMLRDRWRAECAGHWPALVALVARANGTSSSTPPLDAPAALASAEAHVFERRSVTPEHLLLREALIAGRGYVDLPSLRSALATAITSGRLLRSGEHLTSRDALEAEKEFTSWAHHQRHVHPPLGRQPLITDTLTSEQATAVSRLLSSTDGVVILQGDAGTGKTTSLRAVVAGIAASGTDVFGCAPSAAATHVLRQELTPSAETLQRLLVDTALQDRIRGHTLIVDEAGLISTREMLSLCRLAARHSHRLLLVGDTKQHHSVEAGDALRALQQFSRIEPVRLTQIHRQRDPAYRSAVALLARGDAYRAFQRFQRLKAVHELAPDRLFATAAADYVSTLQSGQSCLVIAPVWRDIHTFTTAARSALRASGLLQSEERPFATFHSYKWTREEKRRPHHYRSGDVILFHQDCGTLRSGDTATVLRRDGSSLILRSAFSTEHRFHPGRNPRIDVGLSQPLPLSLGERLLIRTNVPSAELRNGDIVEVTAFNPDHSLQLRDGRTLPATFQEFSHGYATTSHAAQGRTVDRGILLLADDSLAAANLKQAYVSNSRFRSSQAIYTTNLLAAREAMMRPADRLLALEAVPGITTLPPHREIARIGNRAA